jgi:hypothetical protein
VIEMKIEPDSLGIPLNERKQPSFLFFIFCILGAAYAIGASRLSEWLTAIFILGPAIWVALIGPSFLYRLPRNSALSRGFVFALRIAFLIAVSWYVAPFAVAVLDGWLHS